jgi:hypothetical protein
LYTEGKIPSPLFAYYMADSPHQSTLEFGGFDPATYIKAPLTDVTWIPLSGSNMYWEVRVEGFRYGRKDWVGTDAAGFMLPQEYSFAVVDI